MNPTILTSLILLFSSTMLISSSSSWFMMWSGLEINMMSFIPLIFSQNNKMSSESMIKYFLIQVSGSLIFLFSMVISSLPLTQFNSVSFSNKLFFVPLTLSIFLKLGCAPTHQWFPSVTEGMNWLSLMVLLTWQKIAPMTILINSFPPLIMIYLAASLSALIGSLGGFNQILLRKIMAFSSITHLGWMLILIFNKMIWMMYILTYIILNMTISMTFFTLNKFHLSQMKASKSNSMMITINFLSMGGLPPLLGFFPKWMTISWLISWNPILSFILIISSLINLSFYMRTSYKMMMLKSNNYFNSEKMTFSKMLILNSLSFSLMMPTSFLMLS